MIQATLRAVFDALRTAKKVNTQVEFAAKIGYTESSISKFFKNKQMVDTDLWLKIKNAYPEIQESGIIQEENKTENENASNNLTLKQSLMEQNRLLIETLAGMQRTCERLSVVNERMADALIPFLPKPEFLKKEMAMYTRSK